MKKLEDMLLSDEVMQAPSHEVERLMMQHGTELMREMLQAHYAARAAQERPVEVVGADGIERDQVRIASRRLETPFGDVTIERRLYQAPGVEGLAPLDAALGLPDEHYSHAVRKLAAEECARGSYDEVAELIAKRTGAKVPKRQLEQLTVRAAQDFDAFYATRPSAPEFTNDLLVLSFDGKGIAMRHADLREATRKAAEAEPRRLHTRLTKGEKPNRKRMAQVATVYSLAPWKRTSADVLHGLRDDRDAARPRPTNKRVWASALRSAVMKEPHPIRMGAHHGARRSATWVPARARPILRGWILRAPVSRLAVTAVRAGVEELAQHRCNDRCSYMLADSSRWRPSIVSRSRTSRVRIVSKSAFGRASCPRGTEQC